MKIGIGFNGGRKRFRRRSQNKPAPIWAAHAHNPAGLQHSMKLLHSLNRMGQVFHEGMVEDAIEATIVKGQGITVCDEKLGIMDSGTGSTGSCSLDL
ncbi:MAG: hypothetical protein ABIK18_06480 [candidate division WOR-3 bacterium]